MSVTFVLLLVVVRWWPQWRGGGVIKGENLPVHHSSVELDSFSTVFRRTPFIFSRTLRKLSRLKKLEFFFKKGNCYETLEKGPKFNS